jgi:type IV conjugative transfer system coupling protein TraD
MKQQSKQFIRGGQIFLYQAKMFAQVTARISKWAMLLYFALVCGLMVYFMWDAWPYFFDQFYAKGLMWLGMGAHVVVNDHFSKVSAKEYLSDPIIQRDLGVMFHAAKIKLIESAIIGFFLFLTVMYLANRSFIKLGRRYSKDQLLSGTRVTEKTRTLNQSVQHAKRGVSDIKLFNNVLLPKRSEFQGFFFHGSTGSGKTQAMMTLLDEIERSGDAAIIYDKECTIKPHYFNKERGDVELNPLSEDCANWDMWAEFNNPLEWANYSMYLMPKSVQGSDPFWVDAARTIFNSLAWRLRDHPERSPIFLLRTLLTTSLEELQKMLKGTEAENLVSTEIEKTAISIKSVLATYTKSLRFLEGLDKRDRPPFSINQWAREAAHKKNWLFITSKAKYHHEMKPLLTSWLGLAMSAIQSLQVQQDTRIWLVMDELASLHRLEMLSDTLADIRKFGGCVAIGLQSIAQAEFLYGQYEAHAITDLLNTSVYSRSPKHRIAKWVANDLGEQAIKEVRESQSYGPNPIRDGNTIGTQRISRLTVDSSAVMMMDDLEFYVRLLGHHPILHTHLDYKARPEIANAFSERPIDFDALEKMNKVATQAEQHPGRDDAVKKQQAFDEESSKMAENADYEPPGYADISID